MNRVVIDVDRYLNTYYQLQEAIEGLNEEQLKWKAAADKWSVTEVLSHIADHHIVVSFRIREILSGSAAVLSGFNQDAWVNGQLANEGSVPDVLNLFQALLSYNSLLFGRLSAEDWDKTAVNFKGETVDLTFVVEGFIKHVQRHLGQIDRIKAGLTVT